VRDAFTRTLDELGALDIVVAQAGLAPMCPELGIQAMLDCVDVNLLGAITTINARYPPSAGRVGHRDRVAGHDAPAQLRRPWRRRRNRLPVGEDRPGRVRPRAGRGARAADVLGQPVHPTNVDTPMLHNRSMYRQFAPDVDDPTREQAEAAFPAMNAMPVPFVSAEDISNAVLYLASDESRYVTGMQLRIGAGGYLKVAGSRPRQPAAPRSPDSSLTTV
jgi:NAD(P)-dependent dehydrogenase (short-subunit alcohol dehydrogenase family)